MEVTGDVGKVLLVNADDVASLKQQKQQQQQQQHSIMEWKLVAFRPIGRHRMRLEGYVKHNLKVKKNTGESKLKVGMNGNGLLSSQN